jgi:hypothetical protein
MDGNFSNWVKDRNLQIKEAAGCTHRIFPMKSMQMQIITNLWKKRQRNKKNHVKA